MRKQSYIPIAVVVLLSIILISVSPSIYKTRFLSDRIQSNITYEEARVLEVNKEALSPDPKIPNIMLGYQEVKVEILKGKYSGEKFDIKNSISRLYNVKVKKNMKVIVGIYTDNGQISDVSIYSYKRNQVVLTLMLLFFAVVILIGKLKGFKSLIALIFTGITVLFLMIPLIFRGMSPILAAIITAVITTTVMMILIGDSKKKIYAATIGAVLGVVTAGLISYVAGKVAHLSGLTMNDAENILYIADHSSLKIEGLMFASILIASLGAIMDMSMSITSAIFEINAANPKQTRNQLFDAGMNVGRDVIGTMSNTLILAFAGSSLTLLILIIAAKMPYAQLVNLDVINIELIQALSGSIGIVLTVPLTALATSMIIKHKPKGKNKKIK